MRKTLVYFVILLFLGFGIYYFLIRREDSAYSTAEAGFTISDTSAIGKIFLASSDGQSVLVERTDSGWVVNKQYKALPSMLSLLMTTLKTQTALYPVTTNAYDIAVKNLSTDGIKVEVYGRDGKKMRVFYVGGTAVNNTGTNMLMDGAKKPFVVQAASFNGSLRPRYSTDIADWRDRTVFDVPGDQIKSISMQYADKPINSFTIAREGNTFTVKADTNISRHLDAMNLRRVNVYLKYFTNLNNEGFLNGLADMDSTLKHSAKHSTVDIEKTNGQHLHADFYWMALNRRSKNATVSSPDVPDQYDADRLYAVYNNNKDTALVQHFVFDKIFRKAFEFYQKDAAVPDQQKYAQPKNVMMHKG